LCWFVTDCDLRMENTLENETLARIIERDLLNQYGPLIGKEDLRVALGYRSNDAFRQALSRNTIPIPVFEIEHRKGKFALVKDLAVWLEAMRNNAKNNQEDTMK